MMQQVMTSVMQSVMSAVGGGIRGNIGPYPMPDPEPLDTPDLYVDSAATGTGTGEDWTNAYTTIMAAHAAASTGDVIEISGGASGKTYTEYLYFTKAVTVQGSTESGHDGQVLNDDRLWLSNTSGTLTLNNFKCAAVWIATNRTPIRFWAGSNTVSNNMIYGSYSNIGEFSTMQASTHVFNSCIFNRNYRSSDNDARLLFSSAASDLTFNYCVFDHTGNISALPAGSSFVMNNCLVLNTGQEPGVNGFVDIGDSASTTVSINATAFFGMQPVKSGASSVLTVDRCFWNKEAGVTAAGTNIATFDSSDIATITNTFDHVLPKYTQAKNTLIGEYFIRYDDRNNLGDAVLAAAKLNPEVVLTHAVELHGRILASRPTAQNIDDMRTLLVNGNGVISHGGDHTDNTDMGTINISSTGTSPILGIVATQSGDSTTWSNTLTVTINGTPQAFDLMTSPYDTIGELIAALNGAVIGDGTVTCTKSNAVNVDDTFSGMLEVTTAQSISSNHEISFDRTAYNQYEVTEPILDLTFYINAATDRNGSNAVAGTTIAAPSPAYVCQGYASPYGNSDLSIGTLFESDANILIANRAAGSNNGVMYDNGQATNMYNFLYTQIDPATQSDDNFATAAYCAAGPYVNFSLWHGGEPLYNGTIESFKEMLVEFGLGSQTMTEWATYIRTDGGWTISEPNATFTGTADDYLSKGDYALLPDSPMYKTGSLE